MATTVEFGPMRSPGQMSPTLNIPGANSFTLRFEIWEFLKNKPLHSFICEQTESN